MHVSIDGWLGANPSDLRVVHIPTQRTCRLDTEMPLAVVWHWSASGVDDQRGDRDSQALARWIADPHSDARASWHAIIDRNGTVIQSAPFTVGTWHVGKPGIVQGYRARNVNACTIGIELENLGELQSHPRGLEAWPFDGSRVVPASRGTECAGGLFDAYTAEQEAAAEALVRALCDRFAFPRSAFGYGHSTFDSPRKRDPGPAWMADMLPRILDRVFAPATRR
jgi:N-acetyl-anhydromuramyl-L-alanine amidase AmpD